MADGARLSAFISISISTHFVFQAEIKITEAVPGRGSATPRAPALLRVLTELPAAKPRKTYSCGSLVHRCGWCFARLEDAGFFAFVFPEILLYSLPLFLDMCPPGMCGPAHHPSAFMLTPLASWEGLWGHSVSPVGTYERHETRRAPSSGGRLQLPFGGSL